MAETPTPNYGLTKPEDTDNMAAFDTWLNPNWDKLTNAVAPPSGATLPQSGTYKVGDRFYLTTTKSIYINVCQDAAWGWYWRPVQDAISPWFTVPTTCLNLGTWTLNPVPANPFAIALDHRGKAYWRGVIGITAGTIPRNVSHNVFKSLPTGIRPRSAGAFMTGHETLAVGTDGTNLTAYQGVRVFLTDDAPGLPSVRAFGGTAEFNRVYLNGIQYAVGTAKYTAP